jgi:hypothetical protein
LPELIESLPALRDPLIMGVTDACGLEALLAGQTHLMETKVGHQRDPEDFIRWVIGGSTQRAGIFGGMVSRSCLAFFRVNTDLENSSSQVFEFFRP